MADREHTSRQAQRRNPEREWTPELRSPAESAAELASEYEDLLHTVWRCERDWAFDDRIALAVGGLRGRREKAR